jgi:hypothetical protein
LKDRKISFGVQIQGNDYRHFISAEGGAGQERAAVLKALEAKLDPTWFLSNTIFSPPLKFDYKNKTVKGKFEKFFAFHQDKFRYSKAGIHKLLLPDLAQAVCRSLCTARQVFLQSGDENFCASITEFFKVPDDSAKKLS